jgi:hypothetical protein
MPLPAISHIVELGRCSYRGGWGLGIPSLTLKTQFTHNMNLFIMLKDDEQDRATSFDRLSSSPALSISIFIFPDVVLLGLLSVHRAAHHSGIATSTPHAHQSSKSFKIPGLTPLCPSKYFFCAARILISAHFAPHALHLISSHVPALHRRLHTRCSAESSLLLHQAGLISPMGPRTHSGHRWLEMSHLEPR